MGGFFFLEIGVCVDWVNEYMDDIFCNDEFEYYGNLQFFNVNGKYDFKFLCEFIMEDDINLVFNIGNGEVRILEEKILKKLVEKFFRKLEIRK